MTFSDERLTRKNGVSATISVKDWLLIFLSPILTLIPIAGHFLYIAFLIYLAAKEDTAKSIQSFARVELLTMVLMTLIASFKMF